jgi:hypothetical protein
MKLLQTILLALTFALFVMGVHQTSVNGFLKSYFIFAFAVSTFLGYGYVKGLREAKEKKEASK